MVPSVTLLIPPGRRATEMMQVKARRTFLSRLAGAVAPIAVLAFSEVSVSAQTASDFAQNLNPLFQGVLARPGNLSNTLQYAVGASQAGDIESAISTYEQLLFYNPKLSRTRFDLGVLYYELGSYDMARGYLQTALEMHDVTSELQQKIDDLLALIDKKLQPDQFTGFGNRAGIGPELQQRLLRQAGLELVRHIRPQLRPRFRNPDRRDV
jgi:tetratricopeptide (TPR) repeat protein